MFSVTLFCTRAHVYVLSALKILVYLLFPLDGALLLGNIQESKIRKQRQPTLCIERLTAPQASAFHSRVHLISGELDPRGGFRGPLCPHVPSSPAPTPSRTPGVPLSMGPAQHHAWGRGTKAWVLPRSYDKPSCGGSFLAPSRHQPVLPSASDLGGSAWWLGMNV